MIEEAQERHEEQRREEDGVGVGLRQAREVDRARRDRQQERGE
jgi:hypothetical protein